MIRFRAHPTRFREDDQVGLVSLSFFLGLPDFFGNGKRFGVLKKRGPVCVTVGREKKCGEEVVSRHGEWAVLSE